MPLRWRKGIKVKILSILRPLARLAENYEIVGNHLAAREMYGRGLRELANNVDVDEEPQCHFFSA